MKQKSETLKYHLLYKGLLLLTFFVIQKPLMAQDIHWSQFHNAQVYLNPALTAVFNGDTRFHGHYRSQWSEVPVSYQTFSGAIDTKLYSPKLKNSLFGLGLVLNSDEAGDSNLSMTNIAVSAAFTHQLAAQHFLTLGVQGAFTNQRFDFDDLRWHNQYNETRGIFVPSLPHNEPMDNVQTNYADFSVGLNYHFQIPAKRTKIDAGAAMHHVNNPVRQFYDNGYEDNIYRRLNLYGMGTVGMGTRWDLLLMGTAQFQGPHSEIVPSVAARFHLNTTKTQETALQVGMAYRFSEENVDALAPMLEIFFRQWHVGFSYDINLSDFNFGYGDQGTNGLGGPEITVSYVITKVRLGDFKICPIY